MSHCTPFELEREILALQELKTPALQAKWRQVFGIEPPRNMRAGFLRRAIAYRLQEQTFGGLKSEARRELQRSALALRKDRTFAVGSSVTTLMSPTRKLSPGTRLMREWNGATELVDVVDDGFIWRDRRYRTLSAVAVAITGTKWSGPKFFGLDRYKPNLVKAASRAGHSLSDRSEATP